MITDEELAEWEDVACEALRNHDEEAQARTVVIISEMRNLRAEVRRLREVAAKEREVGARLERQAVVAWLRDVAVEWSSEGIAAAIERGEHLK